MTKITNETNPNWGYPNNNVRVSLSQENFYLIIVINHTEKQGGRKGYSIRR